MSNDIVRPPARVDKVPWCDKCNRYVDRIEVETPTYRYAERGSGMMKHAHTGEVIVIVQCHGETYRESNLRGRLP